MAMRRLPRYCCFVFFSLLAGMATIGYLVHTHRLSIVNGFDLGQHNSSNLKTLNYFHESGSGLSKRKPTPGSILQKDPVIKSLPLTKKAETPVKFYGEHLTKLALRGKRFVSGRSTSLLKRSPNLVVPNIVHYVWFGSNTLRFHHMLGMMSAYKYIKPEKIVVHCDHEPTGKWWQLVKKNITTLEVRHVKAPAEIFGNRIGMPEIKSDVVRLEILMKYGGIYLDFDVLALTSFEELRHYEITMGIEYHGTPGRLNNGIIVANNKSKFLKLWYESFHYFVQTSTIWDHQGCIVPYYMQYEFPHLIHVEQKSLNYPSGLITKLIYDQVYDWSHNYAMHLWFRSHRTEHSPDDIKRMNTTFGQIARYIFYNSKKIIK